MIKVVFIDIDNTLLDFNECAKESIKKSFEKFGLVYNDQVFPTFTRINNGLWLQIEDGSLTRKRLHEIRFNLILEQLGIDFDGILIEKEFKDNLFDCAITVDGALELVQYLSKKYMICTASNAIYDQQVNRLQKVGIYKYISKMFISEKIGYSKPTKEFFDVCFSNLDGVERDQVVMIGDSLSADVKGGKDYGLKTIWYNHNGIKEPNEKDYDYYVNKLLEIKNIL